tara:strand:+ start:352 stop:696 length:345 start_codon:yes stop_codon:yes gene_type:complete
MDIRNTTEKLIDKTNQHLENQLGDTGTTVHINDTVAHRGPFFAITALEAAVVDASECTTNIIENGGSGNTQALATNFTIPAGVTIYGNFLTVELDSGVVLAYAKKGVEVTVDAS